MELLSGNTKDALLGLEFVLVKGGCFRMGSDEVWWKPVHEVCLDDYCIGKYEVTQGSGQRSWAIIHQALSWVIIIL